MTQWPVRISTVPYNKICGMLYNNKFVTGMEEPQPGGSGNVAAGEGIASGSQEEEEEDEEDGLLSPVGSISGLQRMAATEGFAVTGRQSKTQI